MRRCTPMLGLVLLGPALGAAQAAGEPTSEPTTDRMAELTTEQGRQGRMRNLRFVRVAAPGTRLLSAAAGSPARE